jgi:hypothetical protein
MISFALEYPRRWHCSTVRPFLNRNFSSSVIWTTSGTLNASCRYCVNRNGTRWPRCSDSEDGPRPVYRKNFSPRSNASRMTSRSLRAGRGIHTRTAAVHGNRVVLAGRTCTRTKHSAPRCRSKRTGACRSSRGAESDAPACPSTAQCAKPGSGRRKHRLHADTRYATPITPALTRSQQRCTHLRDSRAAESDDELLVVDAAAPGLKFPGRDERVAGGFGRDVRCTSARAWHHARTESHLRSQLLHRFPTQGPHKPYHQPRTRPLSRHPHRHPHRRQQRGQQRTPRRHRSLLTAGRHTTHAFTHAPSMITKPLEFSGGCARKVPMACRNLGRRMPS